jgi:hypothetical protein
MRTLGFIVGEAPAAPCRPSEFCLGRFMETILKHSKISESEYMKFGRYNLYDEPEPKGSKKSSLCDINGGAKVLQSIGSTCVRFGYERAFILAMGGRVSHALTTYLECEATINKRSINFGSRDESLTWLGVLKAGNIRTVDATKWVQVGPIDWTVRLRVVSLPHPSGLSRAWNDPMVCETVGSGISRVAHAIDDIRMARILNEAVTPSIKEAQ